VAPLLDLLLLGTGVKHTQHVTGRLTIPGGKGKIAFTSWLNALKGSGLLVSPHCWVGPVLAQGLARLAADSFPWNYGCLLSSSVKSANGLLKRVSCYFCSH